MSKIVNKWWFSTGYGQTIGIVKCHDDITNQDKFYIGRGYGIDEDMDAEHIKDHGAKFLPDIIK